MHTNRNIYGQEYIRSHRNIYMHVYSSIIHKQEKVWYMNYIYFKKTIKKKIFRKLKLNIHHGLENWSILKISDFDNRKKKKLMDNSVK